MHLAKRQYSQFKIWVPIMIIEHTIFARSNTDQNAYLLDNNIMEEGLVKNVDDQDYREN